MDGVLLDSEPLHHRAINEILAEEGHGGLPFGEYVAYLGTTVEYTWYGLIERYRLEHPFLYYRDRYDRLILEHYRQASEISEGVNWLIGELKARGLRLAVASSSRTEWVETCLAALDLRRHFDAIVTGDMVTRSKPDPEIFLTAAALVRTQPQDCLAFEDAPKGVAAARAAGMFTVAVATPYTAGQDTSQAHVCLRSLADFDLSELDRKQYSAS